MQGHFWAWSGIVRLRAWSLPDARSMKTQVDGIKDGDN